MKKLKMTSTDVGSYEGWDKRFGLLAERYLNPIRTDGEDPQIRGQKVRAAVLFASLAAVASDNNPSACKSMEEWKTLIREKTGLSAIYEHVAGTGARAKSILSDGNEGFEFRRLWNFDWEKMNNVHLEQNFRVRVKTLGVWFQLLDLLVKNPSGIFQGKSRFQVYQMIVIMATIRKVTLDYLTIDDLVAFAMEVNDDNYGQWAEEYPALVRAFMPGREEMAELICGQEEVLSFVKTMENATNRAAVSTMKMVGKYRKGVNDEDLTPNELMFKKAERLYGVTVNLLVRERLDQDGLGNHQRPEEWVPALLDRLFPNEIADLAARIPWVALYFGPDHVAKVILHCGALPEKVRVILVNEMRQSVLDEADRIVNAPTDLEKMAKAKFFPFRWIGEQKAKRETKRAEGKKFGTKPLGILYQEIVNSQNEKRRSYWKITNRFQGIDDSQRKFVRYQRFVSRFSVGELSRNIRTVDSLGIKWEPHYYKAQILVCAQMIGYQLPPEAVEYIGEKLVFLIAINKENVMAIKDRANALFLEAIEKGNFAQYSRAEETIIGDDDDFLEAEEID